MSELSDEISVLLSKLYLISGLKPGFKLDTKSKKYIDTNFWLGKVQWYFTGDENRLTEYLYINMTINDCIDLLTKDKTINDSLMKLLTEALLDSKDGIKSLMKTYKEDPGLHANLEVIINKIDLFMGC